MLLQATSSVLTLAELNRTACLAEGLQNLHQFGGKCGGFRPTFHNVLPHNCCGMNQSRLLRHESNQKFSLNEQATVKPRHHAWPLITITMAQLAARWYDRLPPAGRSS